MIALQAHTPLSAQRAREHARLLRTLADSTRLQIIALLTRQGGDITVNEIVGHFELEQPTISHHLHLLYSAGLVDYVKRGLCCYYYVNLDRLREVHGIIQGLEA